MQSLTRPGRGMPAGSPAAPPGGIVVTFVTNGSMWSAQTHTVSESSWSAWSAWPGHPAILPPLPRLAKSSERFPSPLNAPHAHRAPVATSPRERNVPDVTSPRAATVSPAAQPTLTRTSRTATSRTSSARPALPVRERTTRTTRPSIRTDARPATRVEHNLPWPATFDEWMIDIVRRRALRLNSGARRRGVHGTVRAVDLAHILDRSKDAQGRWICAICKGPVTLNDLSFDHVVALADGGEHEAANLVPAHRKCNEIKGSEKAQYRAQALDRWLSEWATSHSGATPKGATRYAPRTQPEPEPVRRYA